MDNIKLVPEKQTFRAEVMVDVDGQDVRFYAKCTVNFERMTQKVTPIVTTIHEGEDFKEALVEVVETCQSHCIGLLEKHRQAHGLGRQGELDFASSAPSDTHGELLHASN